MSGGMKTHLRHPLARARGLGTAGDAVAHWWAQRVSAVAIIPLGIFLLHGLLDAMLHGNAVYVREWLAAPLVAVTLAAFLTLMLYHARLGIQVVIEDYIHREGWKISLLLLNTFLCGGAAAVSVLAILKLHLS